MANVCGVDRVVRVLGGAALLALSLLGPLTDTLYPWGLIGVVPLLTGLLGWCPAYRIFGFRSCRAA
ncbi:MAG TPA: DUF2892 domain-containing protein [Gammaproteobacteria bacterium]|nr:DUF2892 domain-containing protein [Gammaproteobacteria bacterium]